MINTFEPSRPFNFCVTAPELFNAEYFRLSVVSFAIEAVSKTLTLTLRLFLDETGTDLYTELLNKSFFTKINLELNTSKGAVAATQEFTRVKVKNFTSNFSYEINEPKQTQYTIDFNYENIVKLNKEN